MSVYKHGVTITYECKNGYSSPNSPTDLQRECVDGTFTPTLATTNIVCNQGIRKVLYYLYKGLFYSVDKFSFCFCR